MTKNVSEYYRSQKRKYQDMLDRMDPHWLIYISNLESEIIIGKLKTILNSLTFKFSRQPEMLALIPDRITQINLRINSVVAIRKEDGDIGGQLFKDIYNDPDRPADIEKLCQSVLHAIQFDKVLADKTNDQLHDVIK